MTHPNHENPPSGDGLVKRLEHYADAGYSVQGTNPPHVAVPIETLRQAAARISVLEGEREKDSAQSQPCGIAASQPDAGLDAEPSGPMIEVPLEAFALLWAWCFTPSPEVPLHVKTNDDWPGKGRLKGKRGHLTRVLRPYGKRAMALINDTGNG